MPTPTHREIRAAIKAVIAAADTTAVVHDFERYASNLGDLKKLFVSDDRLMGCHIRLISTKRTAPGVGRWMIRHRWQIRFYMALDDANTSELSFDDWLEAVAEAFRANQTLGQLVGETAPNDSENTDGLQLDDSGPVMFCNVLCHSAKTTLYTRHYI
jgi:hypothetical protein